MSSFPASSPGTARGPFASLDPASLAAFRIGFGLALAWGIARTFLHGRVAAYYVEPSFHFTYHGFEWVRPLPPAGMYVLFAALGVLAVLVTIGLWYRASASLFFLGFTYTFLLEKARFLNHYYMVILVALLLAIVPAQRAFSIDAARRRLVPTIPAWSLTLIRSQIGVVYLMGGVAKLNVDWLRALPLAIWLPERGTHPLFGELFQQAWTAWFFSYGGLLLDLGAWPLLAWKRTRLPTFLIVVGFHLTNATLFGIGIFPWVMIGASTIFFEPDWPRRFLRGKGPHVTPVLERPSGARRRWIVGLVASWIAVQLLFPLRHYLYPGYVSWTEEGHMFAWHMKLRDKSAVASFLVTDTETGEQWLVDPEQELTEWQARKMSGRPDMILDYAHHLARRMARPGSEERVSVHATVTCSLNGRPAQLLVDPTVDLARETRSVAPFAWIVPLAD